MFIPLETNATAMRVIVRLWPIFTTLLIFLTGCVIGIGISQSRYLSDLNQSSERIAEVLNFQFYYIFVTVASLFVIFAMGVGFHTVVLEARRQRLQVAETLKNFDVEKTEAFNPNDKAYVLGEIKKWWAPDKEEENKNKGLGQVEERQKLEEKALRAFNEDVRTKVAQHLHRLQRRREIEITCVFVLLFVPIVPVLPLLPAIGLKRLEPPAWPSMMSDVESLVTPDECYCQWLLTMSPLNVSHTSCMDYATSLGSGEVPDVAVSCFGMWNFNAGAFTSLWFFFILCCALAVCWRSLRWAKHATGDPKRPRRIRACFGASGGVGTLVVALVTFMLVWPPAGVAVCAGGILLTCIVVAAIDNVFPKEGQVAPETVRA